MMTAREEAELVAAARNGDGEAYGILVAAHRRRLITAMQRVLHSRSEAEDAVQDAVLRAYVSLHLFEGKSSFFTWLYRITLNASLRRLRRVRREVSLESVRPALSEIRGMEPPPAAQLLRKERADQLRRVLASLDAPFRQILLLREIEGLDYRTIGQRLGIQLGTVRSRLHRARNKVRAMLPPQEAD